MTLQVSALKKGDMVPRKFAKKISLFLNIKDKIPALLLEGKKRISEQKRKENVFLISENN